MTPHEQSVPPKKRKQKPLNLDAMPFKIDGVYCRLLPLTRGLYAIVDAAEYEWLMEWNWQATEAGAKSHGWYATHRGRMKMHQLIAGKHPDHINRVGLDNRRKNLRPSTQALNNRNASRRKDNTTGFRGVYPHGKKFAALIQVDGIPIFLGVRTEAIDAAGS